MTHLQKSLYSAAAFTFWGLNNVLALNFKVEDPTTLKGANGTDGEGAIMTVISTLLGFVTFIAVIYCLWAGFQILTAGGDEEKLKKGRTVIIQVIIGIVVMWIAYSIVTLVVGALAPTGVTP